MIHLFFYKVDFYFLTTEIHETVLQTSAFYQLETFESQHD